jgi:metal-responsive CopG/Arc/MetJ family transcriptional regulator
MNTTNSTSKLTNKQIRITVRLPGHLREELDQAVLHGNYGFKGRSKWVEEATHFLITIPNYAELVLLDDTIAIHLTPDAFTFTSSARDQLENALVHIRHEHPQSNITLSSIVRTGIIQRLLRGWCPPGGQINLNTCSEESKEKFM